MGEEEINLRVIKPYKGFYTELMRTVLKYGIQLIHTVNPIDFIDAVAHSMKDRWSASLKGPTEVFYEICKAEAIKEGPKDASILFENVRQKMEELWEADIIARSNNFKKAKLEPPLETKLNA